MYPGNLQQRYTDLYFTTATVKDWKHLLHPDKYKHIVTDSLAYLVREKSVYVYAFVIMPNHFHLLWQVIGDQILSRLQLRLMKFVAQQIKFDLLDHHPKVLEHFKGQRNDRDYQFFKNAPCPFHCSPMPSYCKRWSISIAIPSNPNGSCPLGRKSIPGLLRLFICLPICVGRF